MNNAELLDLFHKVGELKNIKRSGWIRCEVPEPESVADHTFRTAFIAMVLGDILDVDKYKLLKMALIHDLAEIIAGDITPYDGISKEEKQKKEESGLSQLLKGIPNEDEYMDLWREYEGQKSNEAIILKNIDKLEMAIQAKEYQSAYPEVDLSEFILEADRQIKVTEIRDFLDQII